MEFTAKLKNQCDECLLKLQALLSVCFPCVRRPLLWAAAAVLLPAVIQLLPRRTLLPLGALAGLPVWLILRYRGRKSLLPIILGLFALNMLRTCRLAEIPIFEAHDKSVRGTIIKILSCDPDKDRCRVIFKHSGGVRTAVKGPAELAYLHKAVLRLHLEPPERSANPGGFDEARWLLGMGARSTAEITAKDILERETKKYNLFATAQAFQKRSESDLSDKLGEEAAGFYNALLLGAKGGLSEKMKTEVRLLGLSHLTAVSGMHLAFLLSPLKLRRLCGKIPRKILTGLSSALILLWNILCGFPPGLVRASVVYLCREWMRSLRLRTDSLNHLAAAGLIMGLTDPFAVLNKGFLWSFGAAASLFIAADPLKLFFMKSFRNLPERFAGSLSTLLSAQTAMLILNHENMPVLSLPIVLMSLLFSALAEIMFIGAMPFIFLSLTGSGEILGRLLSALLLRPCYAIWKYLISRGVQLGSLSLLSLRTDMAALAAFFTLLSLSFPFIRRNWKNHYRTLSRMLLLLTAGLVFVVRLKLFLIPPAPELYFLSVGQGDGLVLIYENNKAVLIDGGTPEQAEKVWIPFMISKGIQSFEAAVMTHDDRDHDGAAWELMQMGRLKTLVVPHNFEFCKQDERLQEGFQSAGPLMVRAAEEGKARLIRAKAGDCLFFGRERQIALRFCRASGDAGRAEKDANESSLVGVLEIKGWTVLLTGDITPDKERIFCEQDKIQTDLLKVGHHGSDTVTKEPFLALNRPRAAFICCGPNRYGHPAPAVLKRLQHAGAVVFRTDKDGAVRVRFLSEQKLVMDSVKSGKMVVFKKRVMPWAS